MEREAKQQWLDAAITRWEKTILRLCFAYLGEISLAEDAVQETFFKAWKSCDGFRGEAEEKTWLFRIAINTCKDILKSAWMRHTDRTKTPEALPEGSLPFDERDDTVTRAVMSLPPKLKEATLLHWYQGLTLEEMVRVLRIPRSTINYRLKKAKAILKTELEDWYHEE